jgi:hypothetical protein
VGGCPLVKRFARQGQKKGCDTAYATFYLYLTFLAYSRAAATNDATPQGQTQNIPFYSSFFPAYHPPSLKKRKEEYK